MAIWQFGFFLVPYEGIIRVHGYIPSKLEQFFQYDGKSELKEEFYDYWGKDQINNTVVESIREMLPSMKSWSDEALMFGNSESDKIEVWTDDIYCAIDVRSLNLDLISSIMKLANKLDCLIVPKESGNLICPKTAIILNEIGRSKAQRFCENPRETLEQLRQDRKES